MFARTLGAMLALVPVAAFLGALLYLDSYKVVRARAVLAMVIVGAGVALLGFVVNAAALQVLHVDTTTLTRYVAPVTEEVLKGSVLAYLVRAHRVGFLVDAAILGFAVGTGFALVENLYYLQ